MAVLAVGHNEVAICSGSDVFVYSKSDIKETRRLLDQTLQITESTSTNIGDENNTSSTTSPDAKRITVCCFCNCGKYFLTCNNDKNLNLWSTSNWAPVNSRLSLRRCQRLQFTKDCSSFIVGDKAGDVYRFKTLDPKAKGEFLLGHLSLLLDLHLTADEKYIISCDRDEKIRVSCYPNAYNIEAYCLGHTEFVTTLALLEENNVLASGSGDGTIRFWKYETGSELHCINCSDIFTGEKQSQIIVEKMSSESNMIAAVFHWLQSAVLFEIGWENNLFLSKSVQQIDFSSNVWDVAWDLNGVWFLFPEENSLQIYTKCIDNEKYQKCSKFPCLQNLVTNDWEYLKESVQVKSVIPSLFKQWYDNMTPYVERKQERIAKKLKTSKNISSPVEVAQ